MMSSYGVIQKIAGAPGPTRTDTPIQEPDFESGASTSSATGAQDKRRHNSHLSMTVNSAYTKLLI